jgi:hypothetical protein
MRRFWSDMFTIHPSYLRFALAQSIGRVLVNLKLAKDTEPTTFSQEELDKYYDGVSRIMVSHLELATDDPACALFNQSYYAGTNSRCRADHSRSIGWRPKKTAHDFFASVEEEVQQVLAKSKKD